MNYQDKLNAIDIENHIWIIYIVIIFASWYSNRLEKEYFINNDTNHKEQYRNIMIKIFSILLIIYLYFLKSAMNDVNGLKPSDSPNKIKLTELSAIGSLFIVVSGLIFLYIAYRDKDIGVEIAFN